MAIDLDCSHFGAIVDPSSERYASHTPKNREDTEIGSSRSLSHLADLLPDRAVIAAIVLRY